MANPIAQALAPFVWGAGGSKKTPEQIAQEKEVAAEILMRAGNTSPVGHWTQGAARVVDALGGVIKERRANAAGAENASHNQSVIAKLLSGNASPAESPATIPMTSAAGEVSATAPSAQPVDMTGNEVYSGFMDTVKTGVQNPYALAAIAATGQRESRFSPGNVNRTWSDPSESGQAGTAGGIMSWRGPRYQALAATGDLSPQGQAKFFLQENPQLIQALNNAGSVEEAQGLMNKAWAFAGHDRPGGETAARLAAAQGFLPTFQNSGEVAAATPEAAIEAISPIQGGSLTDEVAAFEQTPAYSEQFPGRQASTLRPFKAGETRPNADGSYSTEITTTWQTPDGAWVNVPSLWMGANGPQQFDANDEDGILGAMQQYEAQNGPAFKRYATVAEAEAAAQDRSSHGGAGAGSQIGQQETVNTPQQAPMVQEVAQAQPSINPAIIEALSDPQATPQTRAIASALLQQQQGQQEQAAQQQQWMERQRYEQQQKEADPLRRQQLEMGQLELEQARQPKRQPLINAGNGNVYDPNTEAWITAPGGGEKGFRAASKEEANTFGAAAGQFGPDGKFYPLNPPQGTSLQVDPTTGAVTFNQGVGVKPLTEGQSKDSFFTTRMAAASPTLDAYEGALMSLPNAAAGAIPMNLGNYAQSEEYQVARDAGRDFVTAYLRKDSGAALTPAEEKLYGELLLPQPGDKQATVQAKRTRRQIAVEAIKSGMPPSAIDGVLKAINAVPGADKAQQLIETDIPGVTIRRKN